MIETAANIKTKITLLMLFTMVMLSLTSAPARAQNLPPLIRDTEIENDLKEWSQPLRKASGIENMEIILVQSPEINAFVAGGANIFFYTGLLNKTEGPQEVIAVMAHEMGHIAGGHLVATRSAMERASYESILGMVLGLGAAVAGGGGDAANAIILGSQSTAMRRFLTHSRVHEASADQAGFRYITEAGLNPSGLTSFFEKLESEELLPASQQSEYMRTHPLTRDRIEAMERLVSASALKNKPVPEEWRDQHARIKAKLLGFISPAQVAWVYDDRDTSIPARYARAIAAYRLNENDRALKEIDALIALEPDNPYFQELKGQMLVDFSRVSEALPYYRKAVALLPDAALLQMALGHALTESGDDPAYLREAITHLEKAEKTEDRSPRIHRLLATAYGKLGQESEAKLHLAEEAVLQRRLPYAKSQAETALKGFKVGSPEWLRTKDILTHIENLERLEN